MPRARHARGRQFAVGMERAKAADRRHHQRALVRHAEEGRRHVERADVNQPSHAQLVAAERLAIGTQRLLVVGARSEIAEVPRRKRRLRGGFEVEHVEGPCPRWPSNGRCRPVTATTGCEGARRTCRQEPAGIDVALGISLDPVTATGNAAVARHAGTPRRRAS